MDFLEREDIDDNIAIIKIGKSFKDAKTPTQLYDSTRGEWRVKLETAQKADYALSVYDKIVREVYEIDFWIPAEKLYRESFPNLVPIKGRIGFEGKVAPAEIRDKYVGKSIAHLYKRGDANPVRVFLKYTY